MKPSDEVLAFHSLPGPMTAGDGNDEALAALPDDMDTLVRIVQGLVLHEFTARRCMASRSASERRSESHIRAVPRMLNRIRNLTIGLCSTRARRRCAWSACAIISPCCCSRCFARSAFRHALAGDSGHGSIRRFSRTTCCAKSGGTTSRGGSWWMRSSMRAGGGNRRSISTPRCAADRFIIAADAWLSCREGRSDPARFGIFQGNQRGMWFIASNLLKDVAALAKHETLPWDVFGAMPSSARLARRRGTRVLRQSRRADRLAGRLAAGTASPRADGRAGAGAASGLQRASAEGGAFPRSSAGGAMNGDAVAMRRASPEAAGKPAGRREWIGLAVIALPCLLYSMDLTVLNLALPSLSADLRPSSTQLLWIVDIYGFMVAGSADPDGHAGRPHRPAAPADDRRGGLRRGVGAGGVLARARKC